MAYQNKTISNKAAGMEIRFVHTAKDTDGALLEMEASYRPHSSEPVAHYHPAQAETFTVLSGELTVRLEGKLHILKSGEQLHIPANKVHSMWNNSAVPTTVNWQVRPALGTEYFLETAAGLAADGKTDGKGMPGILQLALLINRFAGEIRVAKPPFMVQRAIFLLLTPLAYLTGHKPVYRKYID